MTGAARLGRRRGRAAPAPITGAMALSAARRIVPEAISQGGRVSASPQSPGRGISCRKARFIGGGISVPPASSTRPE